MSSICSEGATRTELPLPVSAALEARYEAGSRACPTTRSTPLSSTVYFALACVNELMYGKRLHLRLSPCPDLPVRGESGEILRRSLAWLIELAGTDEGVLHLRARHAGRNGVAILLSLSMKAAGSGTARPGPEPDNGPIDDCLSVVQAMGGRFRLDFRYPTTNLRLSLPGPE